MLEIGNNLSMVITVFIIIGSLVLIAYFKMRSK